MLQEIETLTGKRTYELFDLIAGTSTGGLIALAVTIPKPGASAPATAEWLVELYKSDGPKIFERSFGHDLTTLWGWAGPKYSAASLESFLRNVFGEARLSSALKPVAVTSYDLKNAAPYFFKSYRTPAGTETNTLPDDYFAWQAARATSAAPTYFPAFRLSAQAGSPARTLVDGGVAANNPTMCAVADANRLFRSAGELLVVSLGTGADDLRKRISGMWSAGRLSWAVPILSVLMDASSDTTDYEVREIAREYHRFQEPNVATDLDDVSRDAIERLRDAAEKLVADNQEELSTLAKTLVAPFRSARRSS